MAHSWTHRTPSSRDDDAVAGGHGSQGGSADTIVDQGPAADTALGGVAAGPRSTGAGERPPAPTGPVTFPAGRVAETHAPRSARRQRSGGTLHHVWPRWALDQLDDAIAVAACAPAEASIASLLYRAWFTREIAGPDVRRTRRPLAGVYRSAHAGSARHKHSIDPGSDIVTIARHDVIASNGWWRTWGDTWTPPRTRPGSIRVLLSPDPRHLAEFVRRSTAAMLSETVPWSLGVATDPRRVRRAGAAVLDLPSLDALPPRLLDGLAPLLVPVAAPMCLPLLPGAVAAYYPDNGMTFGEHRCHLIALGLRHAAAYHEDAKRSVGVVFAAHGIDPATPHRSR